MKKILSLAIIFTILQTILQTAAVRAQVPTPTAISSTINLFGAEIDSSDMEIPTLTLDCNLICFMYQNTVIAMNANNYLNIATYILFAFSCISWILFEFTNTDEEE